MECHIWVWSWTMTGYKHLSMLGNPCASHLILLAWLFFSSLQRHCNSLRCILRSLIKLLIFFFFFCQLFIGFAHLLNLLLFHFFSQVIALSPCWFTRRCVHTCNVLDCAQKSFFVYPAFDEHIIMRDGLLLRTAVHDPQLHGKGNFLSRVSRPLFSEQGLKKISRR